MAELSAETERLGELISRAARVRHSGTDRKWTELRTLLEDREEIRDPDGRPRKLIIFTEHRDTLGYLADRIRTLRYRLALVSFPAVPDRPW